MLTSVCFYSHIYSYITAIDSSSLKSTLVTGYDETLRPGFYGGNVTLASMQTDIDHEFCDHFCMNNERDRKFKATGTMTGSLIHFIQSLLVLM